jgi:hypothetical protein
MSRNWGPIRMATNHLARASSERSPSGSLWHSNPSGEGERPMPRSNRGRSPCPAAKVTFRPRSKGPARTVTTRARRCHTLLKVERSRRNSLRWIWAGRCRSTPRRGGRTSRPWSRARRSASSRACTIRKRRGRPRERSNEVWSSSRARARVRGRGRGRGRPRHRGRRSMAASRVEEGGSERGGGSRGARAGCSVPVQGEGCTSTVASPSFLVLCRTLDRVCFLWAHRVVTYLISIS